MSGWSVDRTIHADGWEIHVDYFGDGRAETYLPDQALRIARVLDETDPLRDAILDACREPDLCTRNGCTRYATGLDLCAECDESQARAS